MVSKSFASSKSLVLAQSSLQQNYMLGTITMYIYITVSIYECIYKVKDISQ